MNAEKDQKLKTLVLALTTKFGREPTEDEVINFINGTTEERHAIWNSSDRGL